MPTSAWLTSDSGVIRAMVLDPRYAGTAYIATAYGVFKSDDGGVRWSSSNRGITTTDVRA